MSKLNKGLSAISQVERGKADTNYHGLIPGKYLDSQFVSIGEIRVNRFALLVLFRGESIRVHRCPSVVESGGRTRILMFRK